MWWFVRIWLPIAVAITGVTLLVYISVQQVYRQALNDPQIQLAEDIAQVVVSGIEAKDAVPESEVNIAASLAPFVAVYDSSGKPLASNGRLDGEMPVPPLGVFAYAEANRQHRVTWQPNSTTRIALVIERIPGERGYVASGRNMREQEERMWKFTSTLQMGWLLVLAATLFVSWAGARFTTIRE